MKSINILISLLSLSAINSVPLPEVSPEDEVSEPRLHKRFNILKTLVAPVAIASAFSASQLPSRSITANRNTLSQIQASSHSGFGAVGTSNINSLARGFETRRSADMMRMIAGGDFVDTKQFPFYMFGYSGGGMGGGTLIAPNVMLTAGIFI